MAACRNLYLMMSRVKANPLPPLVSKTGKGQDRVSEKAMYSLAIVSAASAYAVLVIARHVGTLFPLCMTIGLLTSLISGICLTDFVTSHSRGGQSVYSCIYQSISEVTAYLVGWSSVLSSSALLAALCLEFSVLVDSVSGHQVSHFWQLYFSPSCPDALPLGLAVAVAVVSVTGISYSPWWIIPSTVLAFLATVAITAGMPIVLDKSRWLLFEQFYSNIHLSQVLCGTSVCLSVFLGTQNILRFSPAFSHKGSMTILGPLNFLFFLGSVICGSVLILTKYYSAIERLEELDARSYALAVLPIFPICLLAIEYYHPLLAVVQDMSTDGLVFRSLAKKWKSCCQRVPTLWTFFLTTMITGILTIALSLDNLLKVAAVTPLFTSCVVAITVLRERYKDRDYWQYEPMLQNGSAPHHRSRKRSTEFLPRTNHLEPDSAFQVTDSSDSEDGSETDIDSVVQDYKESVKLAGLTNLDHPHSNGGVGQEPTAKSSSKARFLVLAYVANCLILTASCTVMARANMSYNAALLSLLALTAAASLTILAFLRRLPQGWSSGKGKMRSAFIPWVPGLAFVTSLQFLVHIIVDIWHVSLGWTLFGLFLYLVYGMKNSTAATSFYGMTATAQLSLQPFPFLKESSVRQVILPERKGRSKRKV